jgi:hypothetical protein
VAVDKGVTGVTVVADLRDLVVLVEILETAGVASPSVVVAASTTGLEKPWGAVGGAGALCTGV